MASERLELHIIYTDIVLWKGWAGLHTWDKFVVACFMYVEEHRKNMISLKGGFFDEKCAAHTIFVLVKWSGKWLLKIVRERETNKYKSGQPHSAGV